MRSIIFFLLFFPLTVAAQNKLSIEDPGHLAVLELHGFNLPLLAFDVTLPPVVHNETLYANTSYQTIAHSVRDDLDVLKKNDPLLGVTTKASHRLFDWRWLISPMARFELVGVVHRLDRAAFHADSCGETRFIYRLAYNKAEKGQLSFSRMPMTINLVYLIKKNKNETCKAAAKQWSDLTAYIKSVATPIFKDQAFFKEFHLRHTLRTLELNFQSVRWPSAIRSDLGGHAEYILRVFKKENGVFVPSLLENTPDVEKLKANAPLKQKLLEWIIKPENQKSLDQGVIQIPDEFLATKVSSVSLLGPERLGNAPFDVLYSEKDFAKLLFKNNVYVQSTKGLMKRLNDLSCIGCHQGRAMAGFHFLGSDNKKTNYMNAIFMAGSPHFINDQARREVYFNDVLADRIPNIARPLSVRADQEVGTYGAHCGLGDPSFKKWTCESGLTCQQLVAGKDGNGRCLPEIPIAGSPCYTGKMTDNANPHKDAFAITQKTSCGGELKCEPIASGFPMGMCTKYACKSVRPGEVCGGIALLAGFNKCLFEARNFSTCLDENVTPALLKSCDKSNSCRDDYVCGRTAAGGGACVPPYFIFQLRLDGHPEPIVATPL